MPDVVAFIRWENYSGGPADCGLFGRRPVSYNSSQERLHLLRPGERLWLVSRCPHDQQYYFTACLTISGLAENPSGSPVEKEFGRFAVRADERNSHDLGKRMPAEGLLRAFSFEGNKPIRFGGSLGQSLQAIRLLSTVDKSVLEGALQRLLREEGPAIDAPFGLWTKCDPVFAEYFTKNWRERGKPLAFLLYDSPPVLVPGAPIFVHSDKRLRLLTTFRESHYVAGHKYTVPADERLAERERVWSTYRELTVDPPAKADFDGFWDRQNGIRSLFLMEDVLPFARVCQFKYYGRGLEWGYPLGVGYRYVSLSQCLLLLRFAKASEEVSGRYLRPLLPR